MTRQNYGSLRTTGGGRRGSGAWQWMIIGFVFGFGCAAIIGLGLVIANGGSVLDSVFAANRPTQTPFVITNTAPPATNTLPPTEELAATATVAQVQIQAPTPTPAPPTPDPANQVSATPTITIVPTQRTASGQGAQIPALLQGKTTLMQRIDGGTFTMGTDINEVARAVDECVNTWGGRCQLADGQDSSPPHSVTVSPFMMEVTEVTYDQYLAFLNSVDAGMGPNRHRNGCAGTLCIATRNEEPNSNIIFDSVNYRVNPAIVNFPVVGVTWYGAQSYCESIGRRLPTEAEWEHAARGPNNWLYPWGDTFDTTDRARTNRPQEDVANQGPRTVGSYPANANGLFDMAGNVAEWVNDWYSPTYYTQQAQSTQPDPQGPVGGTEKSVRGGSWDTPPFFVRSVHRQSWEPNGNTLWIGFRCVAEIDPNAAIGGTTNTTAPVVVPAAITPASAEESNNAQPTLPPPPAQAGQATPPLATLSPG